MDRIPEITDEQIVEMLETMQPVLRYDVAGYARPLRATHRKDTGIPFFVKPPDPRKVAFTWQPELDEEKDGLRLRQIGHMITYHRYAAPSLFKPSIAEVLAQIRDRYGGDWKEIRAFETGNGELTSVNCYSEGLETYHWCVTILYGEGTPEVLR